MFIVCLLVCLFVCLLVCLFICLFTWCSCSSCPLFGKYEKSILSYFYETTKTNTHLTFDLEPRSKLNAQNESPYMISYMSAIQSRSLSCIVFEIFKKKCISELWPPPSGTEWPQLKNKTTCINNTFHTSYLPSLITFHLTVPEKPACTRV